MARIELSDEQRAVVEHPADGGNLLVLAAPGSGKTSVIAGRIDRLMEQGVRPERILAMTFTRRAAGELLRRLSRPGIWTGTFHAVAMDMLGEHPADAGFDAPPRVFDEVRQREVIVRAVSSCAIPRPTDRRDDETFLNDLLYWVSHCKRTGIIQPSPASGPGDEKCSKLMEAYQAILHDAGAVDYDDIVLRTGDLLRQNAEIAETYRNRVRHLFIDEFHDVSPEQMAFIRLLAPPPPPRPLQEEEHRLEQQVMAVADPDQSIYCWRGADPEAAEHFRREYRADVHVLSINFRSSIEIVDTAAAVMDRQRRSRAVSANNPAAGPVKCRRCGDIRREAEQVRDLVRQAVEEGEAKHFGEIAILYRSHSRADVAERMLTRAEIPVARVRHGRFFARPDVRETLRYLDLAIAAADEDFVGALHWPRVAIDELTMVSLRRGADIRGKPLIDHARDVATGAAPASPLTRVAVADLLHTIDRELAVQAGEETRPVIDRLLELLRRRRSPFQGADRPDLLDTQEYVGRALGAERDALLDAVRGNRRVLIQTSQHPDAAAGAVILWTVVDRYLGHSVEIVHGDPEPGPGAFVIDLGKHGRCSTDGFAIDVRDLGSLRCSIALQCWRIGQMALMAFERLDEEPFVLFDLETGSNHPTLAEIIDVAAQPFQRGELLPGCFSSLVKPRGEESITQAASLVNGLEWSDVRDAPEPEVALEGLLAAMSDLTVVGHNIEHFDYPVLRRAASECGLSDPRHYLVDTFPMARRLFPGLRDHKLITLAKEQDPRARQQHRALSDARLNASVFRMLLAELRRQRELDALGEALPLVALGIASHGVPTAGENRTLMDAGVRAYCLRQGRDLVEMWAGLAGPRGPAAIEWLDRQAPESTEDDDRWHGLVTEWRRQVGIFASESADPSILAFLRYAALADPNDVAPSVDLPPGPDGRPDPRGVPASERVAMMTVHSAKGMEWPIVILIGAEDGQFPNFRSSDHAEERRLLYVGMTRAERQLWLFWSASNNGYKKSLSPFLAGLPPGLLDQA